jgi:L-seryl-tRNA(Ser) seleniumtransferase
MTALGASIAVPEAIAAVTAILPEFVEMHDLQRKASKAIARLTGAEAGCVTASASAGITIAVAAAMTGCDVARIHRLPDTTGMKSEVLIQVGHLVSYGAPVAQAIRLAGAAVVPVGTVNLTEPGDLEGLITDRTAAAVYVVSHHTHRFGQLPLRTFAEICHARGIPVVADLASEYDLRGFLADGADIALYSAHKFLGGPTAGIVAGTKALVRAAYLQNLGIGRGMKVGKESVAGTIAALEAWERRDHEAIRRREAGHLEHWRRRLAGLPGVAATIVPDPTANPLDRLEVAIDPARAGLAAWELVDRLASGEPPVIVRDHEVERGLFYLDPCNLHDGEAEVAAERICQTVAAAAASPARTPLTFAEWRARRAARLLHWPD